MNVGIVDITATSQGVILRIRHGEPMAVLGGAEIPALRAALNSAEKEYMAKSAKPVAVDDGADLV